MRDDTIMKVKDMKLEAQSLFLGVFWGKSAKYAIRHKKVRVRVRV